MTVISPRSVDGVLLLDKPVGMSSNAAIQHVRRLLNAAKAGHVGTLDPLASGLLPICLGEATKFSAGVFAADKSYDAEILLGVTTATGDLEGAVTSRQVVSVMREQVAEILRQFTGPLMQTPPMYSALKRAGKPLYAYARAGQILVLAPRSIVIHDIAMKSFSGDRLQINVRCSKGTYIRVLAEDIGRVFGCGATLAALRRITVADFDVARAITLELLDAASEDRRMACLLPVDSLVSGLPEMLLGSAAVRCVLMGQSSRVEGMEPVSGVRLYDQSRRFLGLGEVQPGGRLVPKRLVTT